MQIFPDTLAATARELVEAARAQKTLLVTAESCTGGLLSACLTEVPGASEVIDRGFVTYSNDAKMQNLGVSRKTLADYGAVSGETAVEMAEGALQASHANLAVAITGIAGPGGATPDKPVGLVYIAVANGRKDTAYVIKNNFSGDRAAIRSAAVQTALEALKKELASQ